MNTKIVQVISSVLLLVGFTTLTAVKTVNAGIVPDHVPGEYVISFDSNQKKPSSLKALEKELKGKIVETYWDQDMLLIRRSVVENTDYVIKELSKKKYIKVVEPNFIYSINPMGGKVVLGNDQAAGNRSDSFNSNIPNDKLFEQLWGLNNAGQNDPSGQAGVAGVDVGAVKAWAITKGSRDVVVAVIDTGVDHALADLTPNMWTNEAELNGEADVDDDGNGFVDDIYGYDFANNDGDPKDDHGHGSHVAGTIGGMGNDNSGIVGVNWQVKIMGIKFLTKSGSGSLANAIKSIDYATQMNADMMNNSWGGGGFSQLLKDSIERANAEGILFLAAAGNNPQNNDSKPGYPATYQVPNVVSVAAIDNRGKKASFSAYGPKTVHVGAPGVNVLSTTPGGFKSWSGTSMATPHAAGVAALLLANEPKLTAVEIKDRLIRTSKPLSSLRGKIVSGGMIDAFHALTNEVPPTDPNDPFVWDRQAYSVETVHPYEPEKTYSWTITIEGAKKISAHFAEFQTEKKWDKVTFKDPSGKNYGFMDGENDGSFSPVIDGDTMIIELTTDRSVNKNGFRIDYVSFK